MSEQIDLKHMLDRAQDALSNDKPPLQGDMATLEKSYGKANNGSPCPCDSGRTYGDCCKFLWQALSRGAKNFKREDVKQRRQQVREFKKQEKRAAKTDKWFCRLGVDEKGQPIVDAKGMAGNDMPTFALAGFILSVYHQIMVEDRVMMINGACNKLAGEIMSRLTGKGGPPKIQP